jgi:hypothetical protein
MKILSRQNILTLIFSIFSANSFACEKGLSFVDGFNIDMSYEFKETSIKGREGKDYNTKSISECQNYAGNYIKIGIGMEIPSLFSNAFSFYFDGKPNYNIYRIENSLTPFYLETDNDFLKKLSDGQKKLDSCLDLTIKDEGEEKLELFEGAEGCLAQYFSEDNSWIIKSGICAFRINNTSSFKLGIKENPNCLNKEFLSKEKITPGDIMGRVGAFVYEINPAENINKKLKTLGSIPLNLNLKPKSNLYKNILGSNRDSKIMVFPEIQFKNLKIKKTGEGSKDLIEYSLLVDNGSCKNFCEEGICTNPCNSKSPLVGEVSLLEINHNGVGLEMGNSLFGEVLSPNWQGVLSKLPKFTSQGYEFVIGKKYQLVIDFLDPYLGYLQYLNKNEASLSFKPGSFHLDRGFEISSMDEINPKFTISDLGEKSGNMEFSMGSSNPTGLSQGNSDQLTIGERNLGFTKVDGKNWPPDYDLVCNKNLSICKKPDPSNLGKLSVIFEITGEKDGVYEIKVIKTERKSKIVSEFQGNSFPKIIFRNQEI